VVANAKLLVEGIDVPTIDMVVLAEPVHSPTKILQMAARAQRPSAGKACGYVMVPERRVYSAPTKLPGSTARDALVAFANEDSELAVALAHMAERRREDGRDLPYDEWPAAVRDRVALLGEGSQLERELALMQRCVNAVVVELAGVQQVGSVADKVAWLRAMYPEEKPVGQEAVEVPRELLPAGVASASFRPGAFLYRIGNNWVGGKVNTRLTAEQMAALEELPWVAAWVDGLRQARAKRGVS